MTHRERVEAIFAKKPVDQPVWQPRLEHWYGYNKHRGTLPERYKEMSLNELYKDLGCSMRAYHLFNGCFRHSWRGAGVQHEQHVEGDRTITVQKTPVGELTSVAMTTDLSHLTREYPVKEPADLKVMEYILRESHFEFNPEAYQRGLGQLEDLGAPTLFMPRIPLQRLFIDIMGFENTILAMADYPDEMDHIIKVIEETDDVYYDALKDCPATIINFGDNVHSDMLPPTLFEKYALPYYTRRVAELHAMGKYCHPHWDGYAKPLMKYVKPIGFDGVEALTPEPQGDLTLDDIQEGLGGEVILLDGIPATHFLEQTTMAELERFTREVIERFHPRLILGISDEPSPPADIERVRRVAEIAAEYRKA